MTPVRLVSTVLRLARSPQGRRTIQQAADRARTIANDPKNRERVQRIRQQVSDEWRKRSR